MSSYPLPLLQSPLGETNGERRLSDEDGERELAAGDTLLHETPRFQHYEETSNIQLFFDLFFVANLTSFTSQHEINASNSLKSYVGFFAILWFTWFQVTMYDVRFSTDSVFERIAHGCHFGVMVGLAVVGPQFTGLNTSDWVSLQTLSLILMVNRLVLMLQYCSTLYFVWKYPKSRMPLIIVVVSLFTTSIIYLGISFAYSATHDRDAYIAWYFCSIFEAAVTIHLSRHWSVVSFTGTHIVERLSCLTLIILGEGVIGLTKSLVRIIGNGYNFSSTTIGTIVSAVLILYLLYMLYFDNVSADISEVNRHQLWTVLHFPFHIALMLLMEGINQILSWRHVVEYLNSVFAPLIPYQANPQSFTLVELYNAWNETISSVVGSFGTTTDVNNEIWQELMNLSPSANTSADERMNAADKIQTELFEIVLEAYEFSLPDSSAAGNLQSFLHAYGGVFDLIFGYFFICAGVIVIILALFSILNMSCIANHHERRGHLFAALIELALGIGLTLLSTMVLTDAANQLGQSGWTLPILVFVLLIALVVSYIPRGVVLVGGPGRIVSKGSVHRTKSGHKEREGWPARIGTGF